MNVRDLVNILRNHSVHFRKNDEEDVKNCEVCLQGKITVKPFVKGRIPCQEVLKIVHSDVGLIRKESIGGVRYFVTFIDDSNRRCEIYLLKNKSGILKAFKSYQNFVEKQTFAKIKCLQSDNEGEYVNAKFQEFFEKEGIKERLTVAYTLQKNGLPERINRRLQSGLSKGLWAEEFVTAFMYEIDVLQVV